jgi:hypothetical protein
LGSHLGGGRRAGGGEDERARGEEDMRNSGGKVGKPRRWKLCFVVK